MKAKQTGASIAAVRQVAKDTREYVDSIDDVLEKLVGLGKANGLLVHIHMKGGPNRKAFTALYRAVGAEVGKAVKNMKAARKGAAAAAETIEAALRAQRRARPS